MRDVGHGRLEGRHGVTCCLAHGDEHDCLEAQSDSRRTVEYELNLLAPARGDYLEAQGVVLRPGRTLTVCRLEVFAVDGEAHTLVAAGQQTLICVPDEATA
jgi:acyl-coenzyme A thioesterase PaaI-like protein